MEKILLHLLEINSRVIVPELGAFILRQQDPRHVVFNDLLAFNDGMLSDHLEKNEGLSDEESHNRINEFVEKVKDRLSKGEDVILEGLGTLSMGASGTIDFSEKAPEPVPPAQEKAPATKKATPQEKAPAKMKAPAQKKPAADKKTPAPEKTAQSDSFVLADKNSEVEVDASDDTPLDSDREEPPFTIEKETAEAESLPETQPKSAPMSEPEPESMPEPEPESKHEPEADTEPEPEQLQPEPYPEPEPVVTSPTIPSYVSRTSKKETLPWIAGAVALIIILLAISWAVFPEKVDRILNREADTKTGITIEPIDEVQSPVTEPTPEPSASLEASPETTPPVEPVPEPPADQAPAGKQYYVVAGCFQNLSNAESYVKTLTGKGYNSRIIGTRNDLHVVCFSSHPTKSKAIDEMRRLRTDFDPKAWVLYY